METKKCSKCGEVKILLMFQKHLKCNGGRSNICYDCTNKRKREYNKNNREKANHYNKTYRDKNKKKASMARKEYYVNRSEKQKDADKARDRIRSKIYYHKNKKLMKYKRSILIKKMTDSYVRISLFLLKADCPHELIELKRQQLKLYRATK